MAKTPAQSLYFAIKADDLEMVRSLVQDHPELIATHFMGSTWLHHAARFASVSIVELLTQSGIDVNAPRQNNPDGPLEDAAMEGRAQEASWLLDHGATIRLSDPGKGGGTLIAAVNSGSQELVRLLLEHGADVNGYYGKPRKNALSHALAYGHKEIADLLRSHGATLPPAETPAKPDDLRAEIIRHVEQHLGPVQPLALTEIVPGAVPIRIHVVPPTATRNWLTLFTTGMSERAMTVPLGGESYRYAELMVLLPPDWPLTDEALRNKDHFWPIEWLRRIGNYPHEHQTWLTGAYAILSNGEPPAPLSPNTPFTAILLLTQDSEFGRLQASDGRNINFYTLFPVYTAERNLVLKQGAADLVLLFDSNDVSMVVNIGRKNLVVP